MRTIVIRRRYEDYWVYGFNCLFVVDYTKARALYEKLRAAGHRVLLDLGD